MKLNFLAPHLIVVLIIFGLPDFINPKPAQAQPNCQCDNRWCYVRSGGGWKPVSQGSMANGYARVCQDAWNQYNNGGSGGSRGLSRSCSARFHSCMDNCDSYDYTQASYCRTRCQNIRSSCQSQQPSKTMQIAEIIEDCNDIE